MPREWEQENFDALFEDEQGSHLIDIKTNKSDLEVLVEAGDHLAQKLKYMAFGDGATTMKSVDDALKDWNIAAALVEGEK